jgi:hypothetical protein
VHRRLVGLLTLVVTLAVPTAVPAQAQPRPDIAADWFAQTIDTAAATGNEVSARRVWAISWLAAQRAIDTSHPSSNPFQDAAVATAVHDVLIALVPSRTDTLNTALAASLTAIPDSPDSPAEQAGIHAGHHAATRTLREREGDGFDPALVNRPYPDPAPAPGVYRLPADATTPTQLAGMAEARPFRLDRTDRFRPGPPPALDSDTYRRDLDEVRRLGSGSSVDRTPAQTDIALLWAQSALAAYTPALRALIADTGRPLGWKVRLLAAFAIATADAGIAVADSKFTYLWWRPITAIREAGDGSWSPLRPTPAHPEYTSGHAGFAGAAEQVLEHFAGPRTPAPFRITNTVQGVSRDYPRGTPWAAITAEVVDARVWLGVHYRTSDEVGAALGRRVADYDLGRLR